MRWPSLLIAVPLITARIGSPSSRASDSRRMATTPAPLVRTVPADRSSNARHTPSGREHLALVVHVPDAVGHLDRRAAGQGEVALERQQALGGEVDGDERRRACRLHVDGRAAQVELVGQGRREEVLVVGRVAEEEHADLLDELGVRQQVVEHVGVHAAAGEHADRPGEPLRHVARRLQRLPRALEEVAVLRIHDRRIARADAEEGRRRTSRGRRGCRCAGRSRGRRAGRRARRQRGASRRRSRRGSPRRRRRAARARRRREHPGSARPSRRWRCRCRPPRPV